jgi:hypothetical protein
MAAAESPAATSNSSSRGVSSSVSNGDIQLQLQLWQQQRLQRRQQLEGKNEFKSGCAPYRLNLLLGNAPQGLKANYLEHAALGR